MAYKKNMKGMRSGGGGSKMKMGMEKGSDSRTGRGFSKGANQCVKSSEIMRTAPGKNVMQGRDLRSKPATRK